MTPNDFAALRDAVKQDEAFRAKPYDDATGQAVFPGYTLKGKLTIGWGWNLSDDGISTAVAATILDTTLEQRFAELTQTHPVVLTLNGPRQIVLANMAYNLGVPRLSSFVVMWAAIGRGDFNAAADEMLASTWAHQVGARATRLATEMRTGALE
jgi:lysozyme